jgi:hypothetical protein
LQYKNIEICHKTTLCRCLSPRPLHNSILANFIRFFTMKSMVNSQIFARMRVMQRSLSLTLAACSDVRTHTISRSQDDLTAIQAKASTHMIYAGRRDRNTNVLCAAPSPDALQASAFAASAGGGTAKGSASGALGVSSTAAFVGMRTQTIQLLRDGYYRLCEAYMNNVISRDQYNLHLTNLPKVIAMAMAIDAVAGAAIAPAVAIRPNSPGIAPTSPTGGGRTQPPALRQRLAVRNLAQPPAAPPSMLRART